jgi:hypothetical protein
MTQRYSPRPIAAYGAKVRLRVAGSPKTDEVVTGPATSALLKDDPEAWNLAYLSHNYEGPRCLLDPFFTTHVRRTLQFVIRTGETDLVGDREHETVRPILRLPPLSAKSLPLYQAYGKTWIEIIQRRASALASMQDPDNDVVSVQSAAAYLERFTKGESA